MRTGILLNYGELKQGTEAMIAKLNAIKKEIYAVYIVEYLRLSCAKMEDIRRWELPVVAAQLNEKVTELERQTLRALVRKLLQELK